MRREVGAAYDLLTRRRLRAAARAAARRARRARRSSSSGRRSRRGSTSASPRCPTTCSSSSTPAATPGNPELQIGLEFQAPAVSALVGTDFRTLAPLFDWLTPKFPEYLAGGGRAARRREVAAASGAWGAEPLRAALRELLLLGRGPDEYEPAADPSEGIRFRNAFDPEMFELQLGFLGELGPAPTYPYLWQYAGDAADFAAKVETMRARGFDGFFSWCWDRDLTTEALEAAAKVRTPA